MTKNWQKDFFHQPTVLDFWRKAVPVEQTRLEVHFLQKHLGSTGRFLDVPCGNGRHALEFARRGATVTGVDISEPYIREAQERAAAEELRAEFVSGDMRQLEVQGEFDGGYCLGNSFGYFDHDAILEFLGGVNQALKPGAAFIIDSGMTAESLLVNYKEREWWEVGGFFFAVQNRYLPGESCLETEATFVRDGKTEKHTWWHYVYTVAEMKRTLKQTGFETLHLFSGPSEAPYQLGSDYLVLVARRT